MAQLHFPVRQEGLIVPVWVGVGRQETMRLAQAGQAIPPPLLLDGLLDRGSDATVVSARVLQSLGLVPRSTSSSTTAGGQISVRLFKVSVSITDPTQSATAWLTVPDLLAMELPSALPFGDVLIGLDILLLCKLQLDGPGRQFMLEF